MCVCVVCQCSYMRFIRRFGKRFSWSSRKTFWTFYVPTTVNSISVNETEHVFFRSTIFYGHLKVFEWVYHLGQHRRQGLCDVNDYFWNIGDLNLYFTNWVVYDKGGVVKRFWRSSSNKKGLSRFSYERITYVSRYSRENDRRYNIDVAKTNKTVRFLIVRSGVVTTVTRLT